MRVNAKVLATFVIIGALQAGAACAQSSHERSLASCKGDDIDGKMRGCTALINSTGETPETLAIAYFNRGNALEENGQFDIAIQDYDNAIKLDPKNAKAFANRGFAYSSKKDFKSAIDDFTEAIKLDPNDARTYRLRASAYRETAKYDLAIQDCDQAIKLDPNDAALAYYVRGLSKQKSGDKSGAKADIAKAKQLDPAVDQH